MRFDPAFHQMLIGSLLVCDHTKRRAALFPKLFLAPLRQRKTLAQCLSDSYLESDKEKASNGAPRSTVQHSASAALSESRSIFQVAKDASSAVEHSHSELQPRANKTTPLTTACGPECPVSTGSSLFSLELSACFRLAGGAAAAGAREGGPHHAEPDRGHLQQGPVESTGAVMGGSPVQRERHPSTRALCGS